MKYKSITERRNERAKRLKRLELWCELSKVIAIATTLLCLMTCGGCSTVQSNNERIKENCLEKAITWGDVLDCSIILDNLYNG